MRVAADCPPRARLWQIMAVVLAEATSLDMAEYRRFVSTCGSVEQIRLLLSHVHMAQVSQLLHSQSVYISQASRLGVGAQLSQLLRS